MGTNQYLEENNEVTVGASVDFGPLNSLGIGPFRVSVRTDGEYVVDGSCEFGFSHRGLELICQNTLWMNCLPYIERIDYVAPNFYSHAFCQAIEGLAQIAVPERAQFMRVVASELSRIASHLLYIGGLAKSIGLDPVRMYSLRDREKINNLFEMLCGARVTFGYIRIGGVSMDVSEGFVERTYEVCDYLNSRIKEYADMLSNNDIFRSRLKGVGTLTKEQSIRFGNTGPNLRASGGSFDLRVASPYACYSKLDRGEVQENNELIAGDCFDRYNARMKEIVHSIGLVKQVLDFLPEGNFSTKLPRVLKIPAGEFYSAVEGPRGVIGVYVFSDGEKKPARIKIQSPSLSLIQTLPYVLSGARLSDVATIIRSFDVCASEVDR